MGVVLPELLLLLELPPDPLLEELPVEEEPSAEASIPEEPPPEELLLEDALPDSPASPESEPLPD
jgi:hypothetical protein